MKRVLTVILLSLCCSIYAENSVRIEVNGDRVKATIELKENEYIIKNTNFLYLLIESEEYDFSFDGYPEGEYKLTGEMVYRDELSLSGTLLLKEGIEPAPYNINVIFGYQSCDEDGNCFIPVEVSENILIGGGNNSMIVTLLLILGGAMIVLGLLIGKRKIRG